MHNVTEAETRAENYLRENGINSLPIDPKAIAANHNIEIHEIDHEQPGVSGMLLRRGESFAIAYATHLNNAGFERFSISHELGHYFSPGHIDHVLGDQQAHLSRANFQSNDPYEREADHFAVGLLMPRQLFRKELVKESEGLETVLSLSEKFGTSLTSTAIRYATLSENIAGIVISSGSQIDYCFMSDPLKSLRDVTYIRKNSPLPKTSLTFQFNKRENKGRVQDSYTLSLQDWFGSDYDIDLQEEVISLGEYGKTLTVLSTEVDPEELDDDENLLRLS